MHRPGGPPPLPPALPHRRCNSDTLVKVDVRRSTRGRRYPAHHTGVLAGIFPDRRSGHPSRTSFRFQIRFHRRRSITTPSTASGSSGRTRACGNPKSSPAVTLQTSAGGPDENAGRYPGRWPSVGSAPSPYAKYHVSFGWLAGAKKRRLSSLGEARGSRRGGHKCEVRAGARRGSSRARRRGRRARRGSRPEVGIAGRAATR